MKLSDIWYYGYCIWGFTAMLQIFAHYLTGFVVSISIAIAYNLIARLFQEQEEPLVTSCANYSPELSKTC